MLTLESLLRTGEYPGWVGKGDTYLKPGIFLAEILISEESLGF
jgi:hypothetical protein